jgi:hypothetical protein
MFRAMEDLLAAQEKKRAEVNQTQQQRQQRVDDQQTKSQKQRGAIQKGQTQLD